MSDQISSKANDDPPYLFLLTTYGRRAWNAMPEPVRKVWRGLTADHSVLTRHHLYLQDHPEDDPVWFDIESDCLTINCDDQAERTLSRDESVQLLEWLLAWLGPALETADRQRLDWLLRHVSEAEWSRLGIVYGNDGPTREKLDGRRGGEASGAEA
jgi:hypothetical protein